MSNPTAALPLAWVEKIFRKLTLVYGRDFTARWEGQETIHVIEDWAEELAGFVNWPEAIAWALKALPEGKPPTVLEFRALCRGAPGDGALKLSYAAADPAVVAAALSGLKRPEAADPKAWARELKSREEQGCRLSVAQRVIWREALRTEGAMQ